ncbi:hypothetical protein L6164_004916 [Bauhinia variegata]|uniref:Uncharacterized protein n=1 Tax=Bauhinia variegata TaxID=167791 RepID=A0ACB9PPR4_BAUVA|nr:hypothetical protein L6164_004916 [Bauhinia variegata]
MADGKDSFMLDAKSSVTATSTTKRRPCFVALALLRISAILLTAASIAVTVTNTQTVTVFSIQFEAHYYYSSAFKFLVAADAIVCAFSVLTLVIVHLLRHKASQRREYCFYLFLHDTAMMVLLISGCAAATAIGYVSQYGQDHMGWAAICDHVHKFCSRGLVALSLSYLAFFAYLGLTIQTAYKLMSSSPNQ